LKQRIEDIKNKISKAAIACGRNADSVQLVTASKTVSADKIQEAALAGVKIFGENYIQEARQKMESDELANFSFSQISWHFIGHLQTNKAKYAVKMFDLIHSVDSFKLANELNKHAQNNFKVQNILIQVNIAKEATKSGIYEEEVEALIRKIGHFKNISVKGLMIIPPFYNDPDKARPYFKAVCDLRNHINETITTEIAPNVSMDELSMGMSGDFETAIEYGATLVRIGTSVFGKRD